MTDGRTLIRVERTPFYHEDVDFFIAFRNSDGGLAIGEPLKFREWTKEELTGFVESVPVMRLSEGDTQLLIDELWRAGFRPSEGSGSAGSLAATERHLSDMRTIAFKQLGIAGAVQPKTP